MMDRNVADLTVDPECEVAVEEIRKGAKYKYVLLALREGPSLHLDDFCYTHEDIESKLSTLQRSRCHYLLYHDLHHAKGKGELVLVAWFPPETRNEETDLYYRALMLVKYLLKVEHLLILNDGIVSAEYLQNSIRKTLACETNKNIVRFPEVNHPIDEEGLGCLYYKRMVENKEKVAQIIGMTGKTTTYGELLRDSIRLAINLRTRGVGRGDIVAISSCDNEFVALQTYATLFLGAAVCAFDLWFGVNDFVNCLRQTEPKILIVEPSAVGKVERALEIVGKECELIVIGETSDHTPLLDLLQPVLGENEFRPVPVLSLLDDAYVFFTSGSTGVPKTLCHNHLTMQYQTFNFITTQFCWDLILHYSTPYWTLYAKYLGIATLMGTTRLIYRTFYENYWHFTKYRVTFLFLSVTEISTLCTYERPKDADLSAMKIMIGGNVVTNDHLKRMEKIFYDSEIFPSYGMTEVPCGLMTFTPKREFDRKRKAKYPSSVGVSVPGLSYKIVDPETEELLGPNEKGELRIKTPFPLTGYFRVQSSPLWDSNGWLKSGDLAYFTEERCFYVVDRLKNMFKYKDYHIVPSVLERTLESHPSVRKAAVIGMPDEEYGHLPLGVVTLKSTLEPITGATLRDFVDERVADHQRLRGGVKIIDQFPTTSTGKIRKWLLHDMIVKAN